MKLHDMTFGTLEGGDGGELSKVVFSTGAVFLQQPWICPRKLPIQITKPPYLSFPSEVFLHL